MTTDFGTSAINHMVAAIQRDMTPRNGRNIEMDTLFFGGTQPSLIEQDELGKFGFGKNYKIVHASFDLADVARGPLGFHVVVTDGLTQAIVLQDGQLWKRDRRSQAVLVFPKTHAVVWLSSKGRLVVLEMSGQHHDHGYDIAREAILARADRKPGPMPVVSAAW